MPSPLSMFQHLRNYATAGAVSAFVGIISFPVLTRSLDVEQYGIMGLIMSTITLFGAVGKLGIQHSVVRFYAQIKNKTIDYVESEFFATLGWLIISLAMMTMILWILAGAWVIPMVTGSNQLVGYFVVATLYIFFKMATSGMSSVLNAQQHSRPLMVTNVLLRSFYLFCLIMFIVFTDLNVYFVLTCYVLSEMVGFIYISTKYLPGKTHLLKDFKSSLAKTLVTFGLPLMVLESLSILLRLTDRYLIQYLIGDSALGQYAASYSLTSYIEIIVTSSIIVAVRPRYTELWESKGAVATQEFLSKGLHLYLMLGIPFVALFSLTAPHLMNILASPEFEAGTVIIPWVTGAILFDGAVVFLAAGLYIQKNTKTLMVWGAVAVVLNIALNLVFIPIFGILGAASVTLISFIVFTLGITKSARRVLAFSIGMSKPFVVAAISLVVWFGVKQLPVSNDFLAVVVKGSIGLVILAACVLGLDKSTRELVADKSPIPLPGFGN